MEPLREETKITIEIDGAWSVQDFSSFFNDLNTISVRANDFWGDAVAGGRDFDHFPTPMVRRIVFASPGQVDIAGLGMAAKAIKELIVDLVRLALEAKDRKQARQARALEMQALTMDVQSKFLRNLSELHDLSQRGVISDFQSQRLGNEFHVALLGIAAAVNEDRVKGAK